MKKGLILVNPYVREGAGLYGPRRLREEFSALGIEAEIVKNAYLCSVGEGLSHALSADFAVYLDKDKYLPRLLEGCGMRLFNRAEAVELCDDKMLTHLALGGKVPMPETVPAPLCYREDAAVLDPAGAVGKLGYPLVVKECYGSCGEQVYLARDREELGTLAERLKLRPHLFQRFVTESAGKDLRVICVGGEAVACMKRVHEGDFRSNLARGGRGEPFAATDEVKRLSETVCRTLRLDYCGIDFLFGREGLLVCEVNSNAFFEGIERTTGVNVAARYAGYIARQIYG